MGKGLKAVGTAIIIAGAVVATGGAALALGAGVGLAGAAGLAGTTVLSIGGFSISASTLLTTGALISGLAGQPKASTSSISTDWLADTDQGIPFAFGRIGVAGLIINKEEYGASDQNFTVCGVISAAGPIKSFVKFTADDKLVTCNGSDMATSPSQWAPDRMYLTTRLGAQPEAAMLKAAGIDGSLPNWGGTYKMSGKASYMLTFVQDKKATAYPSGEPEPVFTIEGLYVWDPRLDSTYPGGSGSCRLNNPATWVYKTNGALFALKWALGLWEDPVGKGAPGVGTCVGGIGSSLDGIDVAAHVYAANVADANAWTCAAWPNSKEDKHTVYANLLQSAGAVPSREAGLISCISRGAPQASIVTVTAADTAGPIELDAAMPRLDRINTITPRYWSEAHNWQMVQAGPVSVPSYVTEDGGRRPRGVDYPYVPVAKQASELAAFDIVDSREGISGTVPFKPHMRRIAPGDCFVISEPGFVLDGQKVKCWGRSFEPATATVRIRFRSETDAKFPFALGQSGVAPPAPSLSVTDPTVVPAPAVSDWALTGQTLTQDGVSVPIIRFDGACSNKMADAVVFEYRPVDTPERPWAGAGIEGPQVIRKEVNQTTPETVYEGSVQYRVSGVLGARRILGPLTTGSFDLPVQAYSRDRNKGGFSDQSDLSISSNVALSTPLGSGQLRFTPNGTGTTAYLGWALGRPGDRIPIIRARVRAAGSSIVAADWDGRLTYQTPALAHALTAGRFARGTFPGVITSTKWRVIEFDASELTDYLTSTITGVRLYLVKPTSPALDIDWLEVGFREGATANTGALADKDAADFDNDVTGDSKPAGFAGRIITGAETFNTTPNGYLALLPNGGARNEVKDCASIGVASDRATGFGIVTTEVRPGTTAGMTQTLRTPTMGTHKRSMSTGTSWRGWTRDLSEEQKPLFGLDLEETAGVLATLANFKTGMGTAAFVQDQGVLATQNSVLPSQVNISYGESLVPDAKMIDAAKWIFGGNMVLQPTNGRAASIGDPATTALVVSDTMEVEPGGIYRAGWLLGGSGGSTWTGRVEIFWYQIDGSASAIQPSVNGTITTDRGMRFLTATAPSDAYFAAIRARRSAGVGVGNAYFSKPKFQRVMGADLVADSAIQLNRHVVRQNGVTPVTDATAITAIGTAAFYENQTAWGTFTKPTAALQYLNDSGRIVDGRGLPLNASSGNGVVLSPEYPVLQALTNPHTSIRVVAGSAIFPGWTLSLPSAVIPALTPDKNYFVFRDLQTSSYTAVLATAAATQMASPDRFLLIGAQKTSVNSGGSVSPPPSPPPGSSPCPDPDVPVAMVGGAVRRAGDLREGDWVWTQHQDTLEWGAFEVTRVRMATNDKYRLDLTDGRSRQYAVGHRFFVDGGGWTRIEQLKPGMAVVGAAPGVVAEIRETGVGPVVQITVRDAQTYQTDGLLSHNIKPVGDL